MTHLQAMRVADGRILARRTDGQSLTLQDREEARRLAEAMSVDDDPILTPGDWYPFFRDFHHKVMAETADFDYLWVKEHHPHLYQSIKAKENALDALGNARLNEVMEIVGEWRSLVMRAYQDQRAL